VIEYAAKQKEHANKLYRSQRLDFAIKKYERAVAMVKKCRDVQSDEQARALAALQVSLLSNLAAAHMAKQVRTSAARACAQTTSVSSAP
jgi:tetratricopeptide (TPR) repeat protein